MRPDGEDPSEASDVTARGYLHEIGHSGRVVRVLVALLLSAVGLVYSGWGLGLIFLGPAAVLLAFAGANTNSRRVVVLFSLPTAIGLCLAIGALVQMHRGRFVILGVAVASTLLAALVGAPRARS